MKALSLRQWLGYLLIFVSSVAWTLLLFVPFLSITTAEKAAWGGGLFIFAEVTWWVAVPLLGKEIVEWSRSFWLRTKRFFSDRFGNKDV